MADGVHACPSTLYHIMLKHAATRSAFLNDAPNALIKMSENCSLKNVYYTQCLQSDIDL